MTTDSNQTMQRIRAKSSGYPSRKKVKTRIERIVDLVKTPQIAFNWPEFMPSATETDNPRRMLESSLRQLPPNLRQHLRHLAKNWRDEWTGKPLNSTFESRMDPLYANLPPQIQMFEDGHPIMLVCDRYQEIRRWHEVLLRIARGEFPIYIGFLMSMAPSGEPIWQRDGLSEALDGEDLRYIRECKECGSVYLEKRLTYTYHGQQRPVEPHCSAKCGQRIRQARSPRKPRPPSRLEDVQKAIENYCKGLGIRRFEPTPENIEDLSEAAGMRPSTIKRCLDYLEAQAKAGQDSAETLNIGPSPLNPSTKGLK